MATYSAPDLNTKPRHMGEFGNAVVAWGAVTPTGGLLADIYQAVVIPGGFQVTDLAVNFPDMDTGGTTLAVKIGYVPVDATAGPTAVLDYFSVADTFLTGTAGVKWFRFDPIKFENPVIVTFTVTTAATTFASGKIVVKAYGDGLGVA